MYCPRLDHFVRFNFNGTVSRCGHMAKPPQFESLEIMDTSTWLRDIKKTFSNNEFPAACVRCQQTEQMNGTSVRLNAEKFHAIQTRNDYLCVGGTLDNVCNSACQTCNETLSTKIGSLQGKNYVRFDNSTNFWKLPLDRITHLDINGGEPSASKNYRRILKELPPSIKSIRINTNCSTVMPEIEQLAQQGIDVTVTVSLDGIGRVHDYMRWPINWEILERNLMTYKNMSIQNLNTWTTVSALNIGDLKNIFNYVDRHNINHSWALLEDPSVLHVKHCNHFTQTADVPDVLKHIVASADDNTLELQEFTNSQDRLRNIKLQDYYK